MTEEKITNTITKEIENTMKLHKERGKTFDNIKEFLLYTQNNLMEKLQLPIIISSLLSDNLVYTENTFYLKIYLIFQWNNEDYTHYYASTFIPPPTLFKKLTPINCMSNTEVPKTYIIHQKKI